jgi:thymidylate kinase
MNQIAFSCVQNPHVEPHQKGLIRSLFLTLEKSAIRYCHWKSNCRLEETLAAAQDIDLYVHRQDAGAFESVLRESRFKLARSRSGTEHPGAFHALGFDEASAELVDVHACYQIVTGDSLVKNYRLPIEDDVIARARYLHGIRIPRAEAELVLFVIRVALKHVNPIEILKVNIRYRKTSTELDWLRQQADGVAAERLCASWFPNIEPVLFRQLLNAIEESRSIMQRVLLGWRVAWRLRGLRRLGIVQAAGSRLWRLLSFARGRARGRRDLGLQTGGLIIALVGPKATGKSTIARELAARLGKHLDVLRIHAGKPPASALSWLPRQFVPIARRILPSERLAAYEQPERRQRKDYSLLYVFRMMLLAYDRRKLLRRALRNATAGVVVIADRYPSETAGAIDSCCFDQAAVDRCSSPLKRWLMLRERALYQGLPRPNLVLRLVSSMETAIQRDASRGKPGGPDAEAVRRRWELENCAQFPATPVINLDTAQPLPETIRAAVAAVWASM